MKGWSVLLSVALVLALGGGTTSAHTTGKRHRNWRACSFRSRAWGVVQDMSYEVSLASGLDPGTVQGDVNQIDNDLSHALSRSGYPSEGWTVQSDLIDTGVYVVAISQDEQSYWDAVGNSDDAGQSYFQQQESDDTTTAWGDMNSTWEAIKSMCA